MTHPNRARLSKLTLGLLVVLATAPAFAQNTTAGVGGTVTGANGSPVAGAEVTITHVESGTVSRATTDDSGRFSARGLRVGGPYTVTITKAGEGTDTEDGIYLSVNQVATVDAQLKNDVTTLDRVQAVASVTSEVFSATKMGSGTSVSRQTIEALPSITGNVQDYMRLDPRVAFVDRASGTISAGGQNPRYNAIRIDGVSASDTFGLEGNNMPTRRQPVSMEAIEALNIDLSSYDVTITGATGAVVDAVTKSGTNDFHGSVYGSYRDGEWFGSDPLYRTFNGFTEEQTYGATFGGPLVKDKLFFFANYEKFHQGAPGADISSSALGKPNPTISQADLDRAATIAAGYGIDAGSLNSSGDTDLEEYALKIDWNISDKHRANFRYSNLEQSKLRINGINSSQVSLSSYWYQQDKNVESYVAQLFSDWTDTFSTEAKVSYRDFSAVRMPPTTAPSIRVYDLPSTATSLTGDSLFIGTETNSQQNKLYTETWDAFVSGSLTVGDHDLKLGANYSRNDVYNIFFPQAYGVYEFRNNDDFAAGRYFSYNLRTPQPGAGLETVAGTFVYDTFGVFAQDQWFVNPNLTLTFGLRADKSSVDHLPQYNPGAQAAFGLNNSQVLKEEWMLQPRFGFNYTFDTERPTQLRGGVGLFRGESPQVWLSNAYNTTGLNYIQYTLNSYDPTAPFSPDGNNQPVPRNPSAVLQNVNFISPDFEQPSTWKANLAFEHELPWYGITASAEVLLTEVNSALYYKNLNVGAPTGEAAQDGRDLFWTTATLNNRLWTSANNRANRNRSFDQVYLVDTTDKGRSRQLVLGLERPFSKDTDWSWNLNYTYTDATEVGGLTASTAGSSWNQTYILDLNEETEATSRYEIRNRVSGALNWKHAFFGDNNTRVGLFYEGRSGRPYSFVYFNDANGDNRTANDLFYVPAGPGDVYFGTFNNSGTYFACSALNSAGTACAANSLTAAQMEQNFFNYLSSNPQLAQYAGQVAPKNGARAGWVNTFDVRITQEFPGFMKGHKAELTLDIQNVGNLLNHDWGQVQDYGFFADQRVASVQGIRNGRYVYNFPSAPDAMTPANSDSDGFNIGVSQWSAQLSFKYKF